jgi:uridine kinase
VRNGYSGGVLGTKPKVFVVGVAGPSGSGKSTVAKRLAARLDGRVLSMESYAASVNKLSFDERAKQNYDAPEATDVALLESDIRDYAAGRAIESPVYDFGQHLRTSRRERVAAGPLLIVEGILALHYDELRQHYNLSIYLHAPDEILFHRRKVRDITERQRALEFIQWQWENFVLPSNRQYVLPSKRYADVVIDSTPDLAMVEKSVEGAISQKQAKAMAR